MADVRWTAAARFDLQVIHGHIAEHSPTAARTTVRRILRSAEILARFPRSGRVVPELENEDLRELISGQHRILYRVVGDAVYVAAVVHGSRDIVRYLAGRPGVVP